MTGVRQSPEERRIQREGWAAFIEELAKPLTEEQKKKRDEAAKDPRNFEPHPNW